MAYFLTIIASILSSSLAATIISAALAEQKERWAFRRDKIEQIYLNAESFCKELASTYIFFLPALDGRISYNSALDNIIEKTGRDNEAFSRLTLYIKMYEPSLIPQLALLEKCRDDLARIEGAGRDKYKELGDAKEFASPLRRKMLELDDIKDELLDQIASLGATVAHQPGAITSALASLNETGVQMVRLFHRLSVFRRRT